MFGRFDSTPPPGVTSKKLTSPNPVLVQRSNGQSQTFCVSNELAVLTSLLLALGSSDNFLRDD
jgi:hypothetical protein